MANLYSNSPLDSYRATARARLADLQQQVLARWPEIQRLAQTDPQIQQLLRLGGPLAIAQKAAYKVAARKLGINLPDEYHPGFNGQLEKNESVTHFILTKGAPIIAGVVLTGGLTGGFGVGGAGVAGGTGGATGAAGGIGTTAGGVGGVSGGVGGVTAGTGITAGSVASNVLGGNNGSPPPAGGPPPLSGSTSWLSPILRTAIPVAGTVVSSYLQNRGNTEAARIEAESLDKALQQEKEEQLYQRGKEKEQTGYDRGQYANYLGRLDPYAQAGPPAVTRLQDVLGRPGAIPSVGNGPMVTLRSPNGQTQQVAADQADWYLSRGATKV